MGLYAFRIISKRLIYFFVRLDFALVYLFVFSLKCSVPLIRIWFSVMFFLCFLFNVVVFYYFSFSPMTFDVALRYFYVVPEPVYIIAGVVIFILEALAHFTLDLH